MNNEQMTLVNLLRVLTEQRCGKKTPEEFINAVQHYLDEFVRKEN